MPDAVVNDGDLLLRRDQRLWRRERRLPELQHPVDELADLPSLIDGELPVDALDLHHDVVAELP
jgi:hypothetical protein